MKEIWKRIEIYVNAECPQVLKRLNKGASDELINETDDFLGVEFPRDRREFYKIHNAITGEFLIGRWY